MPTPHSFPIKIEEFLAKEVPGTVFLVNPYVAREGITLLHGDKSLGKSPLTWELARCVAEEEPFFGHPVSGGKVLYIEVDTPSRLIHERLKLVPGTTKGRWWFQFLRPFNILAGNVSPAVASLAIASQQIQPDLVIVNTLRKVHMTDDKESAVPSQIYGAWQTLFPQAGFVFVHHDKKRFMNKDGVDPDHREEFSGSKAWANDAQVVLHLRNHGDHRGGGRLRLEHSYSQVSELSDPLILDLADNGTTLTQIVADSDKAILGAWSALNPTLPKSEKVKLLVQMTGLSERTVWRRLGHLALPNPNGVSAT